MPACMYAGADYVDDELVGWSRFSAEQRDQQSLMAVKQNVKLLNDNIVKYTVVEALKKIMAKRSLSVDAIEYFLPHYSSEFFRKPLEQGLAEVNLAIPQECWFTNLTSKGNTGSASIFIILEELFNAQRLAVGERILCYIPESGRFLHRACDGPAPQREEIPSGYDTGHPHQFARLIRKQYGYSEDPISHDQTHLHHRRHGDNIHVAAA